MRAARRGRKLPPTEYEWNVEGLILCLLESRIANGWTTPAELIYRLATIEPSELPGLALQRLAAADLLRHNARRAHRRQRAARHGNTRGTRSAPRLALGCMTNQTEQSYAFRSTTMR